MKRLASLFVAGSVFLVACSSNQHSSRSAHSGKYRHQAKIRTYAGGYSPAIGKLPASDMPLAVNDSVVKWVNYFTGSGRGSFSRYLERSGQFLPMMKETLRRKGMPQDLVYLALIESGFRNDAKSHAAAVGTWQFIRSTGVHYGLDVDRFVDERRDPEKAVAAAASYLGTMYNEFGDWYLAMAGYNAGEGRVRQALAACGTRDFWQMTSRCNVFRPETRDYVPKYIAATIIAKNPKQFGFTDVAYRAPLNYETVTINGQADLDTVAEAAGVSTATIRDLNCQLHAGVTPPGTYKVKVPVGRAHAVARNFDKLAGRIRTVYASYTVRRGETLEQIARNQGVSAHKLMAANGLQSRKVRRGTVLSIPKERTMVAHVVSLDTSPAIARLTNGSPNQKRFTDQPTKTSDIMLASADTVTPFESASEAALPSNNGVAAVIRADTQTDSGPAVATRGVQARAMLLPAASASEDLALPVRASGGAGAEVPPSNRPTAADALMAENDSVTAPLAQKHAVVRGDSLGKIARIYGIAEADLRRWNGLARGASVKLGQQIVLTEPGRTPDVATAAGLDNAAVATSLTPSTDDVNNGQPSDLALESAGVAPRIAPPRVVSIRSYVVRRNDTLSGVAAKTGVSVADLRRVNHIRGNQLKAGARLQLVAVAAPASAPAKVVPTSYVVKRGDALSVIARKTGVAIADLRRWNNLRDNAVRVGQELKLGTASVAKADQMQLASAQVAERAAPRAVVVPDRQSAAQRARAKAVVHNVRPGDTLWVLGKRYKVTPSQIQAWNKLSGKSSLRPGQKLTIRVSS